MTGLKKWLEKKITAWLIRERTPVSSFPLSDFEQLSYEIKPCDVLLVEGRSRVGNVIKAITQSPWTHAALYIGRLNDIEDEHIRANIVKHYKGDSNVPLILEALMGEGTIIVPLTKYRHDHIRLCRPKNLSRQDAIKVIAYTTRHLGCEYDVRQLLDLARFVFPYGIIPRRWRSSLFQHNAGAPTRAVCSSLIAAAFASVHFPILPVIQKSENGELKFFKRNFRLYTPPDFDYSPYFEIIKYPYLGQEEIAIYRKLPWDKNGIVCNGDGDCYIPDDYFKHKNRNNVKEDKKKNRPVNLPVHAINLLEPRIKT